MTSTSQQVQTGTPVPAPARPRWRTAVCWILVALAAAGWQLSLDLLKLGMGGKAANPLLANSCGSGPGESLDCLSVLKSPQAFVGRTKEGAMGTPVAAFGMAYFSFVGIWYLLIGVPTRSRMGWHIVITVVVLFGALVSLSLVNTMANQLHRWCVGCVWTHITNGGIVLLTLIAFPWRRPRTAPVPYPRARLGFAGLIAAVAVAYLHFAVITLILVNGNYGQVKQLYLKIVEDPEYAAWRYREAPAAEIPLDENELFVGDPASQNTVVVFSDFQCPACRLAHATLDSVLGAHPQSMRIAYKNFPQDPSCNPTEKSSGHPGSCAAARAAEAAERVGGAESAVAMRRLLFERHEEIPLARFGEWAVALGLDKSAFEAAMASEAVAERVRADIDLGAELGVSSTPAIFLNGKRVEHWRNSNTWAALLGIPPSTTHPALQP